MPTNRRQDTERAATFGRVNWQRLRRTTDEEIAQQIATDPDTAPGMADLTDWEVVRRPLVPDVRRLRAKLGLSQAAFAQRFGLRTRTVQEWEQGRAVPDQTARVLLRVIEQSPDAVARAAQAS